MDLKHVRRLGWLALPAALAACGGGGNTSTETPPPVGGNTKVEAATQTALNNAACRAITSFYWEIGDVSGMLASGTGGVGGPAVTSTTTMNVASASKWVYGMYATEKRGATGLDADADVRFLNFTSGYSNSPLTCAGINNTVAECLAQGADEINPVEAAARTYHYNSGHMLKHASMLGLDNLNASGFGIEVTNTLKASDPTLSLSLAYFEVQPATAMITDAANYARLLRKMLVGSSAPLRIAALLGRSDYQTCTLTSAPCNARYSPTDLDWHYALGHWVEDDAATVAANNVAYSSAGAFGFYPWVNQARNLYGIVAREEQGGTAEGFASASCGQQIRLAYVTGVAR
ncbi:MAG: hypothetical protein IV093_06970 [Rubrivivax sp.]|nr:hypothetical protein [Rubrivivax sp.]